MGIKVVATHRGYYKQLIEEGQLFEIPDERYFSKKWMRKFKTKEDTAAEPAPKRRTKKKPVVLEEAETLSEVQKATPPENDWMA